MKLELTIQLKDVNVFVTMLQNLKSTWTYLVRKLWENVEYTENHMKVERRGNKKPSSLVVTKE